MKWLDRIWNALKYVLAPIVAYFKGRFDGKRAAEIRILKGVNEEMRKRYERNEKIRAKYNNIRNDIDRSRNPSIMQTLQPVQFLDDKSMQAQRKRTDR